jgi:ATP-binding protein involved in chromosome partitioning
MPLKMFGKSQTLRNVIGIAAGKGGVGKSSLTVNLAYALQKLGYSVGILDADLYGPSIRRMLQEDSLPKQKEGRIVPAFSKGIPYISMSFFRSADKASCVRAPIANGLIGQFVRDVDWGSLDFLLIDFPPGTGDIQITLSQMANLTGALVITTPQKVAIDDVRKCIEMFDQVKIPLIGLVENMSYFQSKEGSEKNYLFGKDGGKELALERGIPLLGTIPIDPKIGQYLDAGESIFSSKEPVQGVFLEIGAALVSNLKEIKKSLRIVSLQLQDPFHFQIQWSDGLIHQYRFSDLQSKCPCAACIENPQVIENSVSAREVRNVGHYGIKIDFSSGCSHGIYGLDFLRELAK